MAAVEIERFHEPQDADLAASFLASHGIEAFVADHHISTLDPLIRLALGGIRLMAAPGDVDQARELLARAGRGEFATDGEPPEPPTHASPALTAGVLAAALLTGGAGGLALTAARRPLNSFQVAGFALISAVLVISLGLFAW